MKEINCFPYCGPRDINNEVYQKCEPYNKTLKEPYDKKVSGCTSNDFMDNFGSVLSCEIKPCPRSSS